MSIATKSKWLTTALCAAGVLALGLTLPAAAHAGNLKRLSAMTTAMDGNAILLPSGVEPGDAGVIEVYSNTVKVPGGQNVLYVTISANGLGDCDGIALQCLVDGENCLQGTTDPDILPPGWVVPLGNEYDGDSFFGLSGVNYQFCTPINKGNHNVQIFGATEFGDCNTYLEAVHVFVDSSKIKGSENACGSYATPNPVNSPD
jgi:hypothetical protein